jgi:predicted RNA polymerase sigma factor
MSGPEPASDPGHIVTSLFRHESGRLVASLSRLFGPGNMDVAEDVVQDTLAAALEAWRFGLPDNPAAWLNRAARNRAIDLLRTSASRKRLTEQHAD